jgi:hypothetical protein
MVEVPLKIFSASRDYRRTITAFEREPRNPSLDVSIPHVLSKNPHLFSGVHDNALTLALTRALSKSSGQTTFKCFRLNNRIGLKNVSAMKISGY